ncbi:hypothetical protein B0T19DRAFT_242761 [Cercophora scortea]|uniref:Uncharacterized protein n=1 Tax=Cercophora scortea TaxID=314031 RepID=A0AAE0M799_9PEZI|nr:hypothetical protein B0T19DRAFT_242761 [Cercophora scortea]
MIYGCEVLSSQLPTNKRDSPLSPCPTHIRSSEGAGGSCCSGQEHPAAGMRGKTTAAYMDTWIGGKRGHRSDHHHQLGPTSSTHHRPPTTRLSITVISIKSSFIVIFSVFLSRIISQPLSVVPEVRVDVLGAKHLIYQANRPTLPLFLFVCLFVCVFGPFFCQSFYYLTKPLQTTSLVSDELSYLAFFFFFFFFFNHGKGRKGGGRGGREGKGRNGGG